MGNGGEHLLADFEHQAAGGDGARRRLLDQRLALAGLGIDQRLDLPAGFKRIEHQFQPLGHEGAARFPILFLGERLDILDDRIGERGDLLHLPRTARAIMVFGITHHFVQRLKRDVESARAAWSAMVGCSRMISSPDSTRPPMPRIVSIINSCME